MCIRINYLSKIASIIFIFFTLIDVSNAGSLKFTLQSSAFHKGDLIPAQYTCSGKNISPQLYWKNAPKNTKSFVLIADDPDAPAGNWTHWIIFNLPSTISELSENLTSLPSGSLFGKNSWGKSVYGGPCPPSGEHRYYFKLYALDILLDLSSRASKSEVESAMKGHVLANTELMGRYKFH